jgi:hypothetical protein
MVVPLELVVEGVLLAWAGCDVVDIGASVTLVSVTDPATLMSLARATPASSNIFSKYFMIFSPTLPGSGYASGSTSPFMNRNGASDAVVVVVLCSLQGQLSGDEHVSVPVL